jgi:hypothetical protein
MGNTPFAMMGAKHKAKGMLEDATGGSEADKKRAAEVAAKKKNMAATRKERDEEFKQKQTERAERKSKLSDQWAANKKANS